MNFWQQQGRARREARRLTVDDLVSEIAESAVRYSRSGPDRAVVAAEHVVRTASGAPAPLFAQAADMLLLSALTGAWRRGWQPVDVWQMWRRRQREQAVEFVVGAIAAEAARYPGAAVHPRWRAQLAELGATVWWDRGEPYCAAWARREGVDTVTMLATVIGAMTHISGWSAQPLLMPPPGSPDLGPARASTASGAAAAPGREVDPKMLAKVRGLLAKAESTEFPEEADAFFAKAQELMSRYSLERAAIDALAEGGSAIPVRTDGRRIWLDNPYVSAKSMLVSAVAGANRCRSVIASGLGMVTVVGEETDTEIVEVLTTSLLVQAGRAMLAAGGQVDRRGQSRTKSFRQAFLVSYAQRIGERLAEASRRAEAEVVASIGDGRLLPVLAARELAVQDRVAELFPRLTPRQVSASNSAGWRAGRSAADLANLDVHRAVRSSWAAPGSGPHTASGRRT